MGLDIYIIANRRVDVLEITDTTEKFISDEEALYLEKQINKIVNLPENFFKIETISYEILYQRKNYVFLEVIKKVLKKLKMGRILESETISIDLKFLEHLNNECKKISPINLDEYSKRDLENVIEMLDKILTDENIKKYFLDDDFDLIIDL